jgi:4-hydroxythreonine-4-phosphate dehydrogenase
MSKPLRIAVTMGDPAGIGPEVLVKALSDSELRTAAEWIVVGDGVVLTQTEKLTGIRLPKSAGLRIVDLHHFYSAAGWVTGKLQAQCGRAALEYIRTATQICLRRDADAMVTAPVNKEAIALSGESFSGHTEFIAQLCSVSESRMLLVSDKLKVVHVSTHVSLRQACRLEQDRIVTTIRLGGEACRLLGVARPRIAVCGLNPHAGENGLFGDEEARVIGPAIEAARSGPFAPDGPLPADTVFVKALQGEYDLVVVMYHDQGHIPAKLIDFQRTVNVTLGLPIIRTSVDHGTAFDIAGRNMADPTNMKSALHLALRMAKNAKP